MHFLKPMNKLSVSGLDKAPDIKLFKYKENTYTQKMQA